MPENSREDFQDKLDFVFLSLFSKKINVGIIGGNAGLINAGAFLNSGVVWVLSRKFEDEFTEFQAYKERLIV